MWRAVGPTTEETRGVATILHFPESRAQNLYLKIAEGQLTIDACSVWHDGSAEHNRSSAIGIGDACRQLPTWHFSFRLVPAFRLRAMQRGTASKKMTALIQLLVQAHAACAPNSLKYAVANGTFRMMPAKIRLGDGIH